MTTGGVLTYNDKTREEMLKNSNGPYIVFKDKLFTNNSNDNHYKDTLTKKYSLYEYTHNKETDYSKFIDSKYMNLTVDGSEWETDDYAMETINRFYNIELSDWVNKKFNTTMYGSYDNYIDYIAQIYGQTYVKYKFATEALSNSVLNDKNILNRNSLGVNRVTNIYETFKNTSDTDKVYDTKIGVIGNNVLFYERLLASNKFSESEISKDYSGKYPYITPILYTCYGLNNSTDTILGTKITEGADGRFKISDIDNENDDSIETDYTELLENVTVNPSLEKKINKKYDLQNSEDEDVVNESTLNFTYDEGTGASSIIKSIISNGQKGEFSYNELKEAKTLVQKTEYLFYHKKISTMINRLKIDSNSINGDTNDPLITSGKYISTDGKSFFYQRGRVFSDNTCRSWSNSKMYENLTNAIRSGFKNDYNIYKYRSNVRGVENGTDYLKANTKLNETRGVVRIAPTKSVKDLKKCMFSIENLAWKDVQQNSKNISTEQKGPNGGRIIWFPPYDINFQENVSVNWNENQFIGRGENVYTYSNTKRSGQLSFTLLIDYPRTLEVYKKGEIGYEDLLKYYAGCNFNYAKKKENSKDKIIIEEEILKNYPELKKTIKFRIYFPNNYSGRYNSDSDFDEDLFEYLMKGCNSDIPDKVEEQIGYRIKEGISKSEEGKEKTFYYRVDYIYSGQTLSEANYVDTIKNNKKKAKYCNYERIEKCFSFVELYTCLKKDETTSGITDETLKMFYDAYTKNIDFNIKIKGTASSQGDDDKNEDISKRRSESVKNILIDLYNFNRDNFTLESEIIKCKGKDINSDDAVLGRYAEVEFNFYDPIIKDTETNVDVLKNKLTKQNYEEYLKRLHLIDTKDYIQNEYEFFESLPEYFKVQYENKINYFNPAFHSVSPEGFNERLTFLQQCTRQGHTISTSDAYSNNMACNMAFGRMPVCVLRIGDFINTRILIESMNISYGENGMQWDLNPEGIGVQPMYAKINLGIILLGGQSLEAPISRLQNAVSFNYYANTGVYDNRSDRASYKDGKVNYKHIFDVNKPYETVDNNIGESSSNKNVPNN